MELVSWRLENEADRRIGDELSRIWCAVLGAVPATVPAKRRSLRGAGGRTGCVRLGMAYVDFGKSRGIVEAEIVHVGSARREWRVMHQDHGRPIKLRRECSVEPTQSLVAQHPAMLIGDKHVEGGKPYWVIFDRVLQVAFGRQVAGVPKASRSGSRASSQL